MIKWLHHLFNPHCPDCAEERQDKKVCDGCETLKLQLAIVNSEKREMLSSIISFARKEETQAVPVNQADFEKFRPKAMTWNVRKQMLEAEDRKTAALMREAAKKHPDAASFGVGSETVRQDITDLEKELGVEDAKT